MEQLLIALPVLIFSVVLHEVAHGWMARHQGDNTAAMLGRLTLNPVPHIDPIGSVLVPGILAMTGSPILGWARPVPVNPRNYRNFKRGDILVSLAGVVVNFFLAIAFTLLLVATVWASRFVPGAMAYWDLIGQTARFGIQINFVLMLFNLIPIPPLDGSHVFYYLLPAAPGGPLPGAGPLRDADPVRPPLPRRVPLPDVATADPVRRRDELRQPADLAACRWTPRAQTRSS
jgi:Zn-dependent protease